MVTVISMLLIAAFLGYLILVPDTQGKRNHFFDLSTTTSMRGFWCLVVMLVHVPEAYRNGIQDLLGSFAYIGVTFFFMTSGYGLMLAARKSTDGFMRGFWKRRLPKLLIPTVLVNLLTMVLDFQGSRVNIWRIFHLNSFVRQLLVFYFAFWVIFSLPIQKQGAKQLILGITVVGISLLIYVSDTSLFYWPVESFGFLYGVLMPNWKEQFSAKAKQNWAKGLAVLTIFCLLLGVMYLKVKYVAFFGDYLLRIALGIFMLLLILWANVKYPVGNAAGRFLGKISYEVYLIHGLVFEQVQHILPGMNSGCYILVSMTATVLLSAAICAVSSAIHSCGKKGEMSL